MANILYNTQGIPLIGYGTKGTYISTSVFPA
jgi:hypothetical protein